MKIKVVSQQPPGGRCTLYAGYARGLADILDAEIEVSFTTERDAHGNGFPALWLDEMAVQPGDGVILMPADVLAALTAAGIAEERLAGLLEVLEVPLEKMLEAEG